MGHIGNEPSTPQSSASIESIPTAPNSRSQSFDLANRAQENMEIKPRYDGMYVYNSYYLPYLRLVIRIAHMVSGALIPRYSTFILGRTSVTSQSIVQFSTKVLTLEICAIPKHKAEAEAPKPKIAFIYRLTILREWVTSLSIFTPIGLPF